MCEQAFLTQTWRLKEMAVLHTKWTVDRFLFLEIFLKSHLLQGNNWFMISWFKSRIRQCRTNDKMAKNVSSSCKTLNFQLSLSEIRSDRLQPMNEYWSSKHEKVLTLEVWLSRVQKGVLYCKYRLRISVNCG